MDHITNLLRQNCRFIVHTFAFQGRVFQQMKPLQQPFLQIHVQ